MNRTKTVVTLFSGGGGSTLGAIAAGYTPVLSVEYNPAIAAVYAENFGDAHLKVADVRAVDYKLYAGADLLTASPVCTRASTANSGGAESELDISCGQAVARAIDEIRPNSFVLENVPGYSTFAAYRAITDTLDALGYWWQASILNAADFGVPQTRRRLILRASLDGFLPPLPTKTPWRGWYNAVADELPNCNKSELAKWQTERLGASGFFDSVLISSGNASRDLTIRDAEHPCFTLRASDKNAPIRALLVEGDAAGERSRRTLPGGEPCFTLKTGGGGRVHRALLLSDQSAGDGKGVSMRSDRDPAQTLAVSNGRRHIRALLGADRECVSLNLRCLARLQSLPDTYKLPAKRSEATTVIGNMVPPKMAEGIFRSMGA